MDFCSLCNKNYSVSYFKKHLKTQKHKNNIKKSTPIEFLNLPKTLENIILDYKQQLEDQEKYKNVINEFKRHMTEILQIFNKKHWLFGYESGRIEYSAYTNLIHCINFH
tara:strand:+ start:70 stop:396 length:327 start_codon:yes stop_codon:yes gene_type:complete